MSVTSIAHPAGKHAGARSPEERKVREELAAVYRVFGMLGMDDLIYTHISARVPGAEGHFLINLFGLLYEEVTASNLVKIALAGNIVEARRYPKHAASVLIPGSLHGPAPGDEGRYPMTPVAET